MQTTGCATATILSRIAHLCAASDSPSVCAHSTGRSPSPGSWRGGAPSPSPSFRPGACAARRRAGPTAPRGQAPVFRPPLPAMLIPPAAGRPRLLTVLSRCRTRRHFASGRRTRRLRRRSASVANVPPQSKRPAYERVPDEPGERKRRCDIELAQQLDQPFAAEPFQARRQGRPPAVGSPFVLADLVGRDRRCARRSLPVWHQRLRVPGLRRARLQCRCG